MSTRANVVVEDQHRRLFFYRHSDGYPSVAAESLKTFLRWLIDGTIRDNASQASGWLILLGHQEYSRSEYSPSTYPPTYWKCGAYEPTTGLHGDIEYAYVVDLRKKEIRCYTPTHGAEYNATLDLDNPPEPFATITAANINEDVQESEEDADVA